MRERVGERVRAYLHICYKGIKDGAGRERKGRKEIRIQ